jgi:hypothetical protein
MASSATPIFEIISTLLCAAMLFRTHTASRYYVVLGVDYKPFQRHSLTLHFALRPFENISYVNVWIEKGHTIVVCFLAPIPVSLSLCGELCGLRIPNHANVASCALFLDLPHTYIITLFPLGMGVVYKVFASLLLLFVPSPCQDQRCPAHPRCSKSYAISFIMLLCSERFKLHPHVALSLEPEKPPP